MENKTYIRWGIMGLGRIAEEFATNMNKIHPIYAVASRTGERTKEFMKKFDVVKAYKGYEELLNDDSIEVIYVATVNSAHYENIKACLLHGKNVFCEKAIVATSSEFKELEALAKQRGLVLFEAMTIFHMPLMKKIKKLVNDGKLGKIKMIKADFGSLQEDDPTNRFFSKGLGGGAMLDIGTYALSLVRYFMDGEIEEMNCITSPYSTGVDEMWSIAMKSSEDVLASVSLAFRAKLPKVAVISGDKAYVFISNYPRADTAILYYPDGTSEKIVEGVSTDAMLYEIKDVEKCLITGNKASGHLEYTRDVVEWMDRLLSENGYI
ncbi:MAG: Gfo/Idh/MocA family oxidoreductase [Clostridiaceae bacterium]